MADRKDLVKTILGIINDSDVKEDSITDETVLIGEDGLFFDSIDVLELIVQIEKKYGIKIKDNDLIQEKFKTFKTFFDFINENEKK
ncbi:MAG: acyl carrier protein [Spirochaetes bacterium]|nr:acyl carrier protein [Spirochaetota bacterium]